MWQIQNVMEEAGGAGLPAAAGGGLPAGTAAAAAGGAGGRGGHGTLGAAQGEDEEGIVDMSAELDGGASPPRPPFPRLAPSAAPSPDAGMLWEGLPPIGVSPAVPFLTGHPLHEGLPPPAPPSLTTAGAAGTLVGGAQDGSAAGGEPLPGGSSHKSPGLSPALLAQVCGVVGCGASVWGLRSCGMGLRWPCCMWLGIPGACLLMSMTSCSQCSLPRVCRVSPLRNAPAACLCCPSPLLAFPCPPTAGLAWRPAAAGRLGCLVCVGGARHQRAGCLPTAVRPV